MLKCKTVDEVGVVDRVAGTFATVKIPKKSACDGCTVGFCKPHDQVMEIEALNAVHARIGQRVRVNMKTHTYLKGSIIIYGIPALSLLLGAAAGKEILSEYFAGHDPDMISALCGFGASALSFFLIKLWGSKTGRKIHAKPVIEEIIG
jgi:sigma-E factor negative regulatory protein RseC